MNRGAQTWVNGGLLTITRLVVPCVNAADGPRLCPLGWDVAHTHVIHHPGSEHESETITVQVDWRSVARALTLAATE